MRLLILTESFYPLGGGVGTFGLALSRMLSQHGVTVTVVTRRQNQELAGEELMGQVRVVRLAPTGFQRLGKYLTLVPVLYYLIKHRDEFDLIYVWGLRILGPVAVLAGRILGKPVALRAEQTGEISGSFVHQEGEPMPGVATAARLALGRRDALLKRADRFIAISEAIADEFRDAGFPLSQIRRIPNGVDLEAFKPVSRELALELRQKLGLRRSAFLFLYTGRLHRHKGLASLLDAWRHVAAMNTSAHLVLVGANSPHLGVEVELRSYVTEHFMSDTVTFAGRQGEVLAYIQAADAFVLPSQREGLSIALLEAMACGLPAVGTRTSGTVELIRPGENGYLVEIGDSAGMARAMTSLVQYPRRAREMGLASRALVEREFGLEVAASRHLALLSELRSTDLEVAPAIAGVTGQSAPPASLSST
jgi:glycosyltransferase involved in cell wall biosynthesis